MLVKLDKFGELRAYENDSALVRLDDFNKLVELCDRTCMNCGSTVDVAHVGGLYGGPFCSICR